MVQTSVSARPKRSCPASALLKSWHGSQHSSVKSARLGVKCIENEELCVENDEFCIENDEFWIENDECCIKNDQGRGAESPEKGGSLEVTVPAFSYCFCRV